MSNSASILSQELSFSMASSTESYMEESFITSSKTNSNSMDVMSTTAMSFGLKTEIVTSIITTSITSSYILESPLPTLISSSSDSLLTSNSVAVTPNINKSSFMLTKSISVASISIDLVTKVASVTPTSALSSENITLSTESLSITPFSTQTVVALNNTPSSSSVDKSVSTNITFSANEPVISLTQTDNLTQSTRTDFLAATKMTSIILTSTKKAESKGWWISCTYYECIYQQLWD